MQNGVIISTSVIYKASRNSRKGSHASHKQLSRGPNFPFLYHHKSCSFIDAYFIAQPSCHMIRSFWAYPQGPQLLIQMIKNSLYAPLSAAAAQIEISIFYNEIPVTVTDRHDSWRERPVYPLILHVLGSLRFIKMCTVRSWMKRGFVFARCVPFE